MGTSVDCWRIDFVLVEIVQYVARMLVRGLQMVADIDLGMDQVEAVSLFVMEVLGSFLEQSLVVLLEFEDIDLVDLVGSHHIHPCCCHLKLEALEMSLVSCSNPVMELMLVFVSFSLILLLLIELSDPDRCHLCRIDIQRAEYF